MAHDKKPAAYKGRKEYPLLPLRDIVMFPGMATPLFVGRPKSIAAVEYAIKNKNILLLATQKSAGTEDPAEGDIYDTGCVGEIIQVFRMPDGTLKIMVEGLARAKVHGIVSSDPFLLAHAEAIIPASAKGVAAELEALSRSVKSLFEKYMRFEPRIQPENAFSIFELKDAEELSDSVMGHLVLDAADRQAILETIPLDKRLERIIALLEKEIEILKIEKRVKGRVKKQMDKSQKEYYLQEQIKAIHKELGNADLRSEIKELKESILKAGMPKNIEARALRELEKLEQMPPLSAEGTIVRNYLDWFIDLPWKNRTRDRLDTKAALKVLNEDHYGLDEIKERILEYLAVKKLARDSRGPILCLVGPPGVGKTSLGKSIARTLGRKFVRVSLGGVRDEAEIRGHRRTYIGALPGRIIQSMKKAGTVNPVMMLDEVDKMSMDFRGDPSSALLEVLDPEQNNTFSDHYLEVDYDLSSVLFITTANMLHPIPKPLMDRMEVLEISGYTEQEKLGIAQNFLVPKQLKAHGLSDRRLKFPEKALMKIIHNYTREAGVRSLERNIAATCRKVARKVVEKRKYNTRLTPADIVQYLGPEKYRLEKAERHQETGFAVGMAWTQVGGVIMSVEVSVLPGKGKLILTGKLGEVMRESAQAALSYIRSRSERFGLEKDFYAKSDIHIHLPEGAVPKDGPSAGITMVSAMVSAFCKVPVRHDVAMTGEVTLRGRVLQIGGLKEKILAAHRAGIKEIIFPAENEKDLEKIQENVLKEMKFTPVESMDEVLGVCMSRPVFAEKKKKIRKQEKPVAKHLGSRPGIN
jgi:ATP-dependent Lon protease